jgi:acyl-CoA synthetase (AMP-forming)/AMP-acid ligase II
MIKDAGERVRAICDRFWLFTVAAISLMIIGAIVVTVAWSDKKLTPEEIALLGNLGVGLMMIVQKVIEAQQARRLADQLAQSRPANPDEHAQH